ncbi:MAG: hypothetical protein WC627_11890 [Legionella sp.]|jgi:hypothetical protein
MTVRVLSFDFDGCLFNQAYIESSDKDVLLHNRAFLAAIKCDNVLYRKKIVCLGSNRQSFALDLLNYYAQYRYKGSCYPALRKIAVDLDAELDSFLIADIFGNLEAGVSFSLGVQADPNDKHADCKFDMTKASILYAQMHKLAYENPKEPIVFEFFDDKGEILGSLEFFYNKYPQLIPENVRLRLNHYAGKDLSKKVEIPGIGFIDSNYRQTVKDMVQIASRAVGISDEDVMGTINVARFVTPLLLNNRKPFIHLNMTFAANALLNNEEEEKDLLNTTPTQNCLRPDPNVLMSKLSQALGELSVFADKSRVGVAWDKVETEQEEMKL